MRCRRRIDNFSSIRRKPTQLNPAEEGGKTAGEPCFSRIFDRALQQFRGVYWSRIFPAIWRTWVASPKVGEHENDLIFRYIGEVRSSQEKTRKKGEKNTWRAGERIPRDEKAGSLWDDETRPRWSGGGSPIWRKPLQPFLAGASLNQWRRRQATRARSSGTDRTRSADQQVERWSRTLFRASSRDGAEVCFSAAPSPR